MLLRVLSLLVATLFPTASFAQTPSLEGSTASLWDHNGSVVRMFRWPDGRIMIAYDEPRPGLEGLVPRGTVFFVATANGNDLRGKAAVFKEGCKPAEYVVNGRFEGDGRGKLVVRGRPPIRRGCLVTGYAPPSQVRELVLARIGDPQGNPIARTDKTNGSPPARDAFHGVAADSNEYRGACIVKAVWEGIRTDGGGGATYRGCDQEEPPTYLSFQCRTGSSQLSVTSEVVFPRKTDGAVIPFTISVGPDRHVFRTKVDNSGMYESLTFEIPLDHPVVEQLASGSEATLSATGKPLKVHLNGSRQAIEVMRSGCRAPGEGQVVSRAASMGTSLGLTPMLDQVNGMEIGVPVDLPGTIDRATHGLNWRSADGTLSVNLLRFPLDRELMSIFDALKAHAGRVIKLESRSDTAFTLEGIDGGKSAFIVRVEQKGEEKRGLSVVYSLREGAPLAARARQIADTLKAFPSVAEARQLPAADAIPRSPDRAEGALGRGGNLLVVYQDQFWRLKGDCERHYRNFEQQRGFSAFAMSTNQICGYWHGAASPQGASSNALRLCHEARGRDCVVIAEKGLEHGVSVANVTPAAPRPLEGDGRHVRFVPLPFPARQGCRNFPSEIRNAGNTLRIALPEKRTIEVGESFEIAMSGFPVGLRTDRTIRVYQPSAPRGFVSVQVPKFFEATGTLIEKIRSGERESIYPTTMTGQGVTVSLHEHTAGARETVTLVPVKPGRYEIKFQVAASTDFFDEQRRCPMPLFATSPTYAIEVVPKSKQSRLAEPAYCHLQRSVNAQLVQSNEVELSAVPTSKAPKTIGEPTTLRWSAKRTIDPDCRTPLYLVVSTAARTRFEGQGFLAIPKGMPGPFDIRHDIEKTRLFFPLHLLEARTGEFQIKSFQVGDLDVDWALVEVPRVVAQPGTREDFALEQAHVVHGGSLVALPRYRAGEPRLVLRDRFTVDQPVKAYRSISGEFDIHDYDKFYRVLDAKTGELVLERAGTDPRFSPGGRFLQFQSEGDAKFVMIDLYSLREVPVAVGAWAHGDTLYLDGVNLRPALLDAFDPGFQRVNLYKQSASNFLINVDLEGAVVALREINEFRGSEYSDGGKAWRSLIRADVNSEKIVDAARRTLPGCVQDAVQTAINERCHGAVGNKAERAIYALGSKGFIDPQKLFNLEKWAPANWTAHERIDGTLPEPWTVNGVPMETDLRPNKRELSLNRGTAQSQALVAGAEGRLMAVRSIDVGRIMTAGLKQGDADRLLARVRGLGLDLSAQDVARGNRTHVDYQDRNDQELRRISQVVTLAIPSLAGEFSTSADDEKHMFYQGQCYSEQEMAGTAVRPIAFNSNALFESINFRAGGRHGWLAQVECSNGASGRRQLWLITGSDSKQGQIVDLSFELRFHMGFGPGVETFSVYANNPGYGSWPETLDNPRVAFERYLLLDGKWPGGRYALLFDLDTSKVLTFIRNVESADTFGALGVTRDGRMLVQANTNGQLFFYDAATAKVVLRGKEIDDELALFDDRGYYTSSPEGGQFLHMKFSGIAGYSSVAQFAKTLNRPDIIKDILAGKPAPPKPDLTPPPVLSVTAEVQSAAGTRSARIAYETTSATGLASLRTFVDGRPVQAVPLAGEEAKGVLDVPLPPEARWISAVAVDRSGYESVARGQPLPDAARASASRLFAITVGTDSYDDKAIATLTAAKRDADAFAKGLDQQKGGVYSEVVTVPLLDDADLKASLPARLREIAAKATERDTIMLFVAGHGFRAKDGKFHLVTPRTDTQRLEETSLAWDEVAVAFSGVKARVIVFLDACRSGAAGASATNDEAVDALLGRSLPITVIAASKGRQDSEETDKGGEFTNAVLRAIANRQVTDTNGNGAIELAELYAVVKRDVVVATQGRQTPWLARNDMVGEVPLF